MTLKPLNIIINFKTSRISEAGEHRCLGALQELPARAADGLAVVDVPRLDPRLHRVHRVRLHDARVQGRAGLGRPGRLSIQCGRGLRVWRGR